MPALNIQEKFQNCPINPKYSSFGSVFVKQGRTCQSKKSSGRILGWS